MKHAVAFWELVAVFVETKIQVPPAYVEKEKPSKNDFEFIFGEF